MRGALERGVLTFTVIDNEDRVWVRYEPDFGYYNSWLFSDLFDYE